MHPKEIPHIRVDTGPLSGVRANVVREMLAEIIPLNPGVTGFLLHGSIWSPSTQLPESDVDINYTGKESAGPAGELLRMFDHMIGGVRIELCSYFWGDVSRPETLSLPAVVSLARGHILWERDNTLSGTQSEARHLILSDGAWVKRKIEEAIRSFREFRREWEKDEVLTAPVRGDWDFVRNVLMHANGITSAVDLRPPSHARKALFDTIECCQEIGMPEFSTAIAKAVGMADVSPGEATIWCDRIETAYDHARAAEPEGKFYKATYNVIGARAMIERGHAPGAMWPLWRAARECVQSTEEVHDEHRAFCKTCFEDMGQRLGVLNVRDLKSKAAYLDAAIDLLDQSVDKMRSHISVRAQEVFDAQRE
jgi:hypothetical protein